MTKAAFICRKCGVELTAFLLDITVAELSWNFGIEVVPDGRYAELGESLTYREFVAKAGARYGSDDGEQLAFSQGDYLLNSKDVQYRMVAKARHGCCGWQPRGEVNACCSNGHGIGTLHADECWSPLILRLLVENVEKVEITDHAL